MNEHVKFALRVWLGIPLFAAFVVGLISFRMELAQFGIDIMGILKYTLAPTAVLVVFWALGFYKPRTNSREESK